VDIHKPKPWRGFREFLREYLIIVVGVATALGGEQLIEQLHWRHQVAAARAAVAPEYLRVIGNVGRVDGSAPCLVQRMNELQDVLRQAQASGRLPALGPIPNLSHDSWKINAWDGIVAAGVLPHLPQEEASLESRIATNGDYLPQVRDEAIAQWTILATLNGPARSVTPAELAAYNTALARAGREVNGLRDNADAIPHRILRTGQVTQGDAEKAWREGFDQGQRMPLCGPLSHEPAYLSAALPELSQPPTRPF
jgi:hypothetical protein